MIQATLICSMGSDLDVANCARVSFAKESKSFTGRDARLIAYLAEHNHWAPFGHPQASFHVKAPVFVRTQCFKHKVGFVESEVSRRYVDGPPEIYDPGNWRVRATDKKQGSGRGIVCSPAVFLAYEEAIARALDAYAVMIELGVAPEQARMVLPQSMMTEWRWTGSLAAWARFCHLRLAPDAQDETRQVALQVASKMAELFPISWAALAGWRPDEAAGEAA
jgi:thymidylate synthase (FAD)